LEVVQLSKLLLRPVDGLRVLVENAGEEGIAVGMEGREGHISEEVFTLVERHRKLRYEVILQVLDISIGRLQRFPLLLHLASIAASRRVEVVLPLQSCGIMLQEHEDGPVDEAVGDG